MKKIISLLLVLFALLNIFSISVFATEKVSYTITSPYETVNWDTFNQYKAQLHAHTLYSDGGMDIKDVVEEYYKQDYDILAITDHGVVNKGWDEMPEMLPIIGYNKLLYDWLILWLTSFMSPLAKLPAIFGIKLVTNPNATDATIILSLDAHVFKTPIVVSATAISYPKFTIGFTTVNESTIPYADLTKSIITNGNA